MKANKIIKRAALLLTLSGMAAFSTAHAQTSYTWTGTVNNNWDTTAVNWSGSAWVNSQLGTPTRAVFNAAQAGTVNIDPAGVAVQTVTINGDYTFSGGPLRWTMTDTDPGAGMYVFTVGAGSQVTVNSALIYSGTKMPGGTHAFTLNAGSTLTLKGGASFGNAQWYTAGNANATLNLQAGVYNNMLTFQAVSGTINQSAAQVQIGSGGLVLGNSGNTYYQLNHASAVLESTGAFTIGSAAGTAGNRRVAELNILAGSGTARNQVYVGTKAYSDSVLNVTGGSLRMTLTNNDGNALFLLNRDGGANEQTAVFNLSGGVVTTSYIGFGGRSATVTSNTNSIAALRVSGGALYLGDGAANVEGLKLGNLAASAAVIELGGGTLGAVQNWTSSMNMRLTGSNGNIKFRAADEANTARNITLSGTLSGSGGLEKTGNGTLLLSGANTYEGKTIVSAGTLQLNDVLSLGGVADLSVFTGALVNLNYSGVAVIDSLLLDSVTISNLIIGQSYTAAELNTALSASIFSGGGLLSISTIPEPSTWTLLLTGAALLVLLVLVSRQRHLIPLS